MTVSGSTRRRTALTATGAALTGALAATALLGGGAAATDGAAAGEPPPETIVEVTGDAANGFGIHYHGQEAIFPPTLSESNAECSEYDTRVQRVRCRTEVATWYRDLADLQLALRWARHGAASG